MFDPANLTFGASLKIQMSTVIHQVAKNMTACFAAHKKILWRMRTHFGFVAALQQH